MIADEQWMTKVKEGRASGITGTDQQSIAGLRNRKLRDLGPGRPRQGEGLRRRARHEMAEVAAPLTAVKLAKLGVRVRILTKWPMIGWETTVEVYLHWILTYLYEADFEHDASERS